MTIGRGFRRLADLIDSIEATNVEITDVTVPDGEADGALLADIQVRIPPDDTASESVDETTGPPTNGGVDGTNDEPTAHSTNGATAERRDVSGDAPDDRALETTADESGGSGRTDGDGEQVACRAEGCGEVFDTEHGMKIHHTKTHGLSGDGDAPAYRDPDVLREVYAEYDSFTEMTEALGVDVAPQTVRRNMIKHGIHDPEEPDDDRADPETGEADSPALPDSDVDLPGGTTLDDVKAAVASADTLYEVQLTLDLERDRATDLLRELGLLELVHGRVATKHRRDDLKDEIDERLRNSATSD